MKVQRFAVGPAADTFFEEHAAHDYGAMGAALSAAARSTLTAVEGLKDGIAPSGGMTVAQMRSKLDQSAQSSAAKGLLARHMRMFEMVTDAVNREGLLETGLSEQVCPRTATSGASDLEIDRQFGGDTSAQGRCTSVGRAARRAASHQREAGSGCPWGAQRGWEAPGCGATASRLWPWCRLPTPRDWDACARTCGSERCANLTLRVPGATHSMMLRVRF